MLFLVGGGVILTCYDTSAVEMRYGRKVLTLIVALKQTVEPVLQNTEIRSVGEIVYDIIVPATSRLSLIKFWLEFKAKCQHHLTHVNTVIYMI